MIDEFVKGENESRINYPAFSQPICWALQIALVELLTSWGIYADAVIGHSSGDIAAAFAVRGFPKNPHERLRTSEAIFPRF